MEETYNIQAIVLNRRSFREADLQIEVFSPERGKLELIARGAKKVSSKLAGHIELLNLSKLMVVRGKQLNYVGGIASENCFLNIKNDLVKSNFASRGLIFFNQLIKAEEQDRSKDLFLILLSFLKELEIKKENHDLILEIFKFRILSLLGYEIKINKCLACQQSLENQNIYFDTTKRNFVCPQCASGNDLLVFKEISEIIKNKKNPFYFSSSNQKIVDNLKKINQSLIFDL